MAKWKLARQIFGDEEFTFAVGDKITVGRGLNNTIPLSSIVISRKHCVIEILNNKVIITDLQSSNGVYVGKKRIPQGTPYEILDSDLIGFGWTIDIQLVDINDNEKYVFKLIKEDCVSSISKRITFQDNEQLDELEQQIAALDNKCTTSINNLATINLKRKLITDENIKKEIKEEKKYFNIVTQDDDIINISDSENDMLQYNIIKKPKIESISDEPSVAHQMPIEKLIKSDNDYLEYEPFNVMQEYQAYEDEPIAVEDSDTDSESEHWYLRLSQNSPGKPFSKITHVKNAESKPDDSSYSQLDDFLDSSVLNDSENEEILNDLITIPPQPPLKDRQVHESEKLTHIPNKEINDTFSTRNIPSITLCINNNKTTRRNDAIEKEEIDGITTHNLTREDKQIKKAQMIEPLIQQPSKKKSYNHMEGKSKKSSRHNTEKINTNKKHISKSRKEERKKKLKEIATKEKFDEDQTTLKVTDNNASKPSTGVKVTSSNRGAFLSDTVNVVKPIKRKDSPQKPHKHKNRSADVSTKDTEVVKTVASIESKKKYAEKPKSFRSDTPKIDDNEIQSKPKKINKNDCDSTLESKVHPKKIKPLTDNQESFTGKPVSKVVPLKPKKSVRFSEVPPKVHVFEIEPGNKMKKTSLIKTTLVDIRQMPVFSLEKITLMKILRWNPHWLEEQVNNSEPPPILGHNAPMTVFHSFVNHHQYVQLIGDLLLMEIWECLTVAYMKTRSDSNYLQMRMASLPPVPCQERCFELCNITVNISFSPSEIKNIPRVGEVILVHFGAENSNNQRFFFIHNIRNLPSPPNNVYKFYTLSLYATYTDKMKILKPGELILGKTLAYISKELMLFEAMEHLGGSPLSDAILRPEPYHFVIPDGILAPITKSQMTLNPSQQLAVSSSVSAALSDRPCIRMVQGPPGTGKSSVICAIVMSYFYDNLGKKLQNRGKILICATSNAAVDELVIRLLNIRQTLPKEERFRMVRVGRAEAMSARARDVSSQTLALRDSHRAPDAPPAPPHAASGEISHLEAKINMWKSASLEAKDPVRIAYCQGRVNELVKRVTLLRAGAGPSLAAGGAGGAGGAAVRPEQLARVERRIIEGADIVVTTLGSVYSNKMRVLKRRIALCIVDEAGQAIEPEALLPLTLDVTRLTLIGDPQQLPGYICSQRAKKLGLGESLFSRLSSCAEAWAHNPVVVLDRQYRMHAHIADYPNRAFYGGRVLSAAPARPAPALPLPPYCILAIASGDKGQGASGANEMEAWGVARIVAALARVLPPRAPPAVITPYNAHKELIKRHLRALHPQCESPVEVNTVDSFQGQERDVVVVSLARSSGVGFLTDAGRMNVMLTRARHALLICLNPHAVLKNNQWRTLVEDAQRRNLFRNLPNRMCQPITSSQVPSDDILKHICTRN